MDDTYVAALGGGYGTQNEGVGSNLHIINLEDNVNPGSIYKVIQKVFLGYKNANLHFL